MDNLPTRKNIRLAGFDYSAGGIFFVTICVANRKCMFGDISDGIMILNDIGILAQNGLDNISKIHIGTKILSNVVMPNHVHFVVEINNSIGLSLANLVKGYKQSVSKNIHHIYSGFEWQKGYYENIVRDENNLNRIIEYIYNNPSKWNEDILCK